MKRLILTLALLPLLGLGGGQGVITGNHLKVFTPAGCAPPTMTYRWAAYSLTGAAYCGSSGSTACTTSGQEVYSIPDSVAGNTATSLSGSYGTYVPSAINGLAAINESINGQYLFATQIPITVTTYTFYVVTYNRIDTSYQSIGGTKGTNALVYGQQNAGANQVLGIASGSTFATGTNTLANNTWYTLAATYNSITGAYALYICSGGSCTSDGSGTSVQTISAPMTGIGIGHDYPPYGYIAEIGYLNGTSVSGIGAWSYCKYGI